MAPLDCSGKTDPFTGVAVVSQVTTNADAAGAVRQEAATNVQRAEQIGGEPR